MIEFDYRKRKEQVKPFALMSVEDPDEWSARKEAINMAFDMAGTDTARKSWFDLVKAEAARIRASKRIEEQGVDLGSGSDLSVVHCTIRELMVDGVPPVRAFGEWYVWDGSGVFEAVSDDRVTCIIMDFEGFTFIDARGRPQELVMSSHRVNGIFKMLCQRVIGKLDRGPGWFEDRPPGIMFRNMFLALTDDGIEAHEPSPTHRAIHSHGFDYDPGEHKCPRFLAYLDGMFEDQYIGPLQEFLGATLFGVAAAYTRAAFVKGTPGTGKSTLVELLKGLMPPGSTCAIEPSQWRHDQHIAGLAGKLLNGIGELGDTQFGDVNRMKAVIAGDEVTGKVVYKPVFSFRPFCAHLIASNEYPRARNGDEAFYERWLVLPIRDDARAYRRSDDRVINFHEVLIREELPGIIDWTVEGMLRLEERGRFADQDPSVFAEWRGGASNTAIFVAECLNVVGPGAGLVKQSVYERYRTWSGECGQEPLGRNKFYAAISREVPQIQACGHMKTKFNVEFKRG